MILTINERSLLRLLASSSSKDYSINELAKECSISPNGALKILNKLKNEGILKIKQIANIKSYKLDFENEKTEKILELAFIPDNLEGRIKIRATDLKLLKTITSACILFGSYITSKQKPEDLDTLFILNKEKFELYKKELNKVNDLSPIKIHDLIQTTKDLVQNIKKQDPVIKDILLKGIVLWGSDKIVEAVENAEK